MPHQRLWQAVDALAASAAPIQQRLYWAGQYLLPLRPDDFALEEREKFIELMDDLTTREPTGDEGSLRATTSSLSDDDAVGLARRIVSLDATYRPLS